MRRVSGRHGWRRVSFAGVAIEVPPAMTVPDEHAIDGEALVLAGAGLRLILDAGPFRDRSAGHSSRPGTRRWTETTAGSSHEVVASDDGDGGTVLAVLLPEPVAATVHVGPGADTDTALDIIRSISHEQGDTHG